MPQRPVRSPPLPTSPAVVDSPRAPTSTRLSGWRWSGLAVVACVALLAVFARMAADWEWLVAVGDHVRRTGEIP